MTTFSAEQILDREFLEIRAKILQIAASFDRIQRSKDDLQQDPRQAQLKAALQVVLSEQPDRAEQIQMIFSRDYDPKWRTTYQLGPRG